MSMRRKKAACRPAFDILFDVGATSVAVGIVHHGATGAELLWHSRVAYAFEVYDDYDRYKRTMFATLLDIGMQLMSDGVRAARAKAPAFKVDNAGVACVLSPPWFFAFVQTAVEEREKRFTVTQATIDALHRQAVVQAHAEQSSFASWAELVGDYTILEHVVQEVKLDGYRIAQWAHKHVNAIALNAYYTTVGQDVHTRVQDILERVLPNHDAQIYSSTALVAGLFERNVAGGARGHASLVV
jgi:hypothetical protein